MKRLQDLTSRKKDAFEVVKYRFYFAIADTGGSTLSFDKPEWKPVRTFHINLRVFPKGEISNATVVEV